MRGNIETTETHVAMVSLLCCSYLAVFFDWLQEPWHCAEWGAARGLLWALGVHRDGEGEVLGVWPASEAQSLPWQTSFADMKVRGVESIRFTVGCQSACVGDGLRFLAHGATELPSIEQMLAFTVAQVAPRHRCAVELALRTVTVAGSSEAAGEALRAFECDRWGESYPQIVAQWRLALAQWVPLFALPASLRRVVVLGDRAAADLQRSLVRAVDRHGSFASQTAAIDFVADALLRAERRQDRARAVSMVEPRIHRQVVGGGRPAPAPGVWDPR